MNTIEDLLLLNWITATGTLFLEFAILAMVLFLICYNFTNQKYKSRIKNFFDNKIKLSEKILNITGFKFKLNVEKIIIWKIFFISLISSIITLVYSEFFEIMPCALCWFERVFMYGITLISGIALFSRNDLERKGIFRYLLTFSIFGMFVSFYHHIVQIMSANGSKLPCPASGGDCGKMIIFEYNHITFPLMAFVLFLLFVVMIIFYKIVYSRQNDVNNLPRI